MSVSYVYQDGAANQYSIKPDNLKYIPVKPEFSSSGTYDGGPEWNIALTASDFESIKKEIEAVIANTAIHTDKRRMGTGRILRFDSENKENSGNWTISNGSTKRALENFLKSFENR